MNHVVRGVPCGHLSHQIPIELCCALHAGGVAVITAGGACPTGFTATSLTSVSLEPPLVSFNASNDGETASSRRSVLTAAHVGVHVLAEDQQQLAQTFATPGIDRFAAVASWDYGQHGVPILADVLAVLVCCIPGGGSRLATTRS